MSYACSGLGEVIPRASYPAAVVQDLLIRKGFNVGPAGASGIWDTRSQLALEEALRRPVTSTDVAVVVRGGVQTLEMPGGYFEVLTLLPDKTNVWPWVVGGGAAIMGLLVWGGYAARQRMQQNRRRR